MLDSFKASLAHANRFMWAAFVLSISVLLLDPTKDQMDILGISIDRTRLLIAVPIALVSILLARQIVIRNAAYILSESNDKAKLKELVNSYPLSEFMRWRFTKSPEVVLLSIFQALFDLIPPLAFVIFALSNALHWSIAYGVAAIIMVIGLWNYRVLRRNIYEPLLGEIRTPD